MTLLCSPKVTHNHTAGVALCRRARGRPSTWARRNTNWFGKNEWVTRNKKHGGGACSFSPAGKHGQIVFFVWVDFSEHKWIILAKRRGHAELEAISFGIIVPRSRTEELPKPY
jgi:hypothetical protein